MCLADISIIFAPKIEKKGRKTMRLSELNTGEKGVIVKVLGHGGFRKRIVEMGFIKGKTVEVLLNAPLRDPIKYKVMGYEISLRRQEAEMIEIISEQEAKEQAVQPDYHEGLGENMHLGEDELKQLALGKRRTINVALVGNPNCGKTSLFNIASGSHEHVGNYSGVTVDAKEGYFDFQGYHFRIVDLPGTYSLSAYSPEEIYVRRHIINETPDIIINVVDSSNLERNLYLTTQLIDMNVRMVIALNMYDELEASGNTLDYVKLSQLFGVPMLPTVSRSGKGIEQLFHVIINIYEGGDFLDHKGRMRSEILSDLRSWHQEYVPDHDFGSHKEEIEQPRGFYRHIHINHGPELERSIEEVKRVISVNENIRHKYSTRFLAIKLLENDEDLKKIVEELPNGKEILAVRDREEARIAEVVNEESEQAITDAKYGFIAGALRETYVDNHQDTSRTTQIIDSIVTHRVWGYPIFFLFLYLMFEGTFVLGDYPMQGIDEHRHQTALAVLNGTRSHNGGHITPKAHNQRNERLSMQPHFMHNLIHNESGTCHIARVFHQGNKEIEQQNIRQENNDTAHTSDNTIHQKVLQRSFGHVVAYQVAQFAYQPFNPLMSCSARLPIYLLLVGAFFPNNASFVLLVIYAIGILLAVVMARLFCRFLVKGDDTPFVMELPPYRMPTSKAIFRHTWEKGAQYLRKMGGIIMVASIVIWALGYYPNHDEYESVTEQQENSYIGRIGKAMEPVIEPLGFDWKLGIGILSGVGAKELVVSTLGVLYADDAEADAVSLGERIPITPLVAFGYMVFVLIYFPCIATLAAIKGESGSWKWAVFAGLYTTALAWLMSFAIYQIGGLFL